MERWTLGLKSMGRRALSEQERCRVEVQLRRARWRLGVGAAGVAGALSCWAMAGEWFGPQAPSVRVVSALSGVLALWLGIRWLRQAAERIKGLRRALAGGQVECFSTPQCLAASGQAPADSGALEGTGGGCGASPDTAQGAARCQLEVLPGVGWVVSRGGEPNRDWVTVRVAELSAGRSEPAIAAWYSFFDQNRGQDRVRERALSPDERLELERLVQRRGRVPRSAYALGAMALIALVGRALGGSPGEALQGLYSISIALAALAALLSVLTAIAREQELKLDLERGSLVVIGVGFDGQLEAGHEVVEVLGSSRRLWSVDHQPAEWRILE